MICYAVARNDSPTLRTAAGLPSPRAALRMLVHVWQRPGVILQEGADGALVLTYRLNEHGVICDGTGNPVGDTDGGVYCPRCHATPGHQEPQYSSHDNGMPYATGVFRCGLCRNLHRPAKLF